MLNYNALTKEEYQLGNQTILSQARYENNFESFGWVTLNQARELGKIVKKGAKGTKLYFKKDTETILINENENGEKNTEVKKVFKYFYVFNLEQLEDIANITKKIEETSESEKLAEVEVSKEKISEVKEVARADYKEFSENLETMGNNHSFYNKGTLHKERYLNVINKINNNNYISLEQKQKLIKKWESLYNDYAYTDCSYVSHMVSGSANRNIKKDEKHLNIRHAKLGKVVKFQEEYEHILNNEQPKKIDKDNLIFECDSYKVIKYFLNTGAERVGFVFYSKIARQLAVALKSRGFRWNAYERVWGATLEKYNEFKEWSETLEENYTKYLLA